MDFEKWFGVIKVIAESDFNYIYWAVDIYILQKFKKINESEHRTLPI